MPTVSPTPIAIYHGPPWVIAIDAGHGGLYYWGSTGFDSLGNRYIEKDIALEVALKVRDWLLTDEQGRYIPVLIRDGDYTLTDFDPGDYPRSQRTELQSRVDVANAATTDVLISVHFNGWIDAGLQGSETYCNPDRSFGLESCQLAWFIQNRLVSTIREYEYDIVDRGTKNDAEVGGDPANENSYLLGTNYAFNPSLMPGVISEILFLSSPADVEFLNKPGATDILGQAYKKALDEYFSWLTGLPLESGVSG